MEKSGKRYIIGGAAAALLCAAVLSAGAYDDKENSMTITFSQIVYQMPASEEAADEASCEGLTVSFTAVPIYEENGMTVFRSGSDVTLLADVEGLAPGEEITINGTIAAISGSEIILSDCLAESESAAKTPEVTSESAEQTEVQTTPQSVSVYVSTSGKYHRRHDCSGMKKYSEMTQDEAIERGYAACKICY